MKYLILLSALVLAGCAAVPEVGMLLDRGTENRSIVVRLDEQKAFSLS